MLRYRQEEGDRKIAPSIRIVFAIISMCDGLRGMGTGAFWLPKALLEVYAAIS